MPIPSFLKNLNSNFTTPTSVGNNVPDAPVNFTLPNGGGSYNVNSVAGIPQSGNVFTQPEADAVKNLFVMKPQAPTSVAPGQPTTQTQPTNSQYTPEDVASFQSIINEYSNKGDVNDIYKQWMYERNTNTGMFELPTDVSLTPEHMRAMRRSADEYYSGLLSNISESEKNKISMQKAQGSGYKSLSSNLSSTPWLEGLRINGLIGGGTADEREANFEYLSTLPEARQIQLVKSGIYNKLGVGERQKFDGAESTAEAANALLQYLPEDFYTDPYKYQYEKFASFLGKQGDPRYQAFQAIAGRLTAPIINDIYGAAVTGGELDRAKQFIPDLATDSTQKVAEKLRNLTVFAEFGNEALLRRAAGMPKEPMVDYFKKKGIILDGKIGSDPATFKAGTTGDNSFNF